MHIPRKRTLQSQKTLRLTGKKNSRAVHLHKKKRHTRIPFVKRVVPRFSKTQILGVVIGITGILMLVVALLTPTISTYIHRNQNHMPIRPDLAFSVVATGKPPIRIIIPEINIDVNIKPAQLIHGYWETSEDSASFGLGSAPPGSVGNTVIFAHAREKLFLSLKNIKSKSRIYILTDTQWYPYEVENIKEVWPNDTYVISPTKNRTLTLFTCSGFFDTMRLVVTAKPM
jgi:LPXTG-site transpeptidase (sortase) family protein